MTTINNWDNGEKLLHHTFYNELRVAPEETVVTLTVAPRASRAYLEKLTQIMFETFSVPCLNYVHQASACVVAQGVYSGLVVLMGHQNVWVVPVHQMRALDDAAVKIPIGGAHITAHVAQLLNLTTTAELEIAQDIKIKHCFVSSDYEADSRDPSRHEVNYEMPDGTVISLSNLRFDGPEAYFKPSLLGRSSSTLTEAIATAISNCDYSLRKKMASNIFLAGGSSLFPNMAQRIERELKKDHSMTDLDIRVKGNTERYSSWVGSSIYLSLSTYPFSTMISKEDYDNLGPSIVHMFYNYPLSESGRFSFFGGSQTLVCSLSYHNHNHNTLYMENPGEYHSTEHTQVPVYQGNTNANQRPLVKMRGLYPIGGPKIVREEFEKLGFEYRPPNTPNEECDSFWVMRFDPPEFKAMRGNQKVNYLPGMTELCIKSNLHSNIVKMKEKFGEEPFSFWPRGFNLPQEYDKLKKYYEDNGDKQIPFIIKPARRACGTGITCITHVSQLNPEDEFIKTETPVAQEYVMNPILLDGFKISFRIYVAITSVSPLRIYVHPSGLTRISSEKYRTDLESFGNGANFIHLTNYDLNKFNKDNFATLVSPEIQHDNMRCEMQYIFDTLRQNGHNVDQLWEEIKEVITKSFLAAEERITTAISRIVHFRSNGYELLGFDFLVDENMKPWLLEVNHAPNLEPHTELETKVKRAAIKDLLQLVDVARVDAISTEEETKQKFEKLQHYIATMEPEEESELMLSKLTRSDVWKIVATQRENARRGDFQRLFPNPDSGKYNEIAWPNRENRLVIKLMEFFDTL